MVIPGRQYVLADLVLILRRRRWLIILTFVAVTGATVIATRCLPNRYRAETLILVVPQRVPESYVRSTVTGRIGDRLQSISQQILSRTRLERIIQDLNLYPGDRPAKPSEILVAQMRRDIDVELVKGDAFRVSYTGDDPQTVMRVTERLASLFIDENLRDRAVLAEDTDDFLESQLGGARRRLLDQEKKLEEYRRRFAGQLPTQAASNLQMIQNNQMQIQALNESMARDRERRLLLERMIADAASVDVAAATAPPPAGASGETAVGTAAQQLEAARQVLRQMELRLTPEHPDIVRMTRSIARLEQMAAAEALDARRAPESHRWPTPQEAARQNRLKELTSELADLNRQFTRKEQEEKRLRDVVAEYQARLEAVPTRESELVDLTRDYDTLQQTYRNLLGKKEESTLATNLERRQIGEQFKVLDPAQVPERPFSPNRRRLNVLGAVAGLAIGVVLVGLLEFTDSTLKTDEDVLTALSLPVLALVPLITTEDERRTMRRRRFMVAATSAAVVCVAAGWIAWKLGS